MIAETYHLDRTVDIHCFASFDLCRYPAKQAQHPLASRRVERDKGCYPDRHQRRRSTHSPGQTEPGRGCREWILTRLGSNIFLRVSYSLFLGCKLRLRSELDLA